MSGLYVLCCFARGSLRRREKKSKKTLKEGLSQAAQGCTEMIVHRLHLYATVFSV